MLAVHHGFVCEQCACCYCNSRRRTVLQGGLIVEPPFIDEQFVAPSCLAMRMKHHQHRRYRRCLRGWVLRIHEEMAKDFPEDAKTGKLMSKPPW